MPAMPFACRRFSGFTADGFYEYAYNGMNQVVAIRSMTDGSRWDFAYDAFGRRVAKRQVDAQGTPVPDTFTYYLYEGEDIIAALDGDSGALLATFTQGEGWDNHLAVTDGPSGSPVTHYFIGDHLGSVTGLVDGAGALTASQDYRAFGEEAGGTGIHTLGGSRWVQPYGYTGRELDGAGLPMYYRARYYDPGTGRFLSEDPIGFEGGVNMFAYTKNSPLIWIDPLGLFTLVFDSRTGAWSMTSSKRGSRRYAGYSGNDRYRNNPAAENTVDQGPIPAGRYGIGAPRDRKGYPNAFSLTPDAETARKITGYGRDPRTGSFTIHHGEFPPHGSWSGGCPIMTDPGRADLADEVNESPETLYLDVFPGFPSPGGPPSNSFESGGGSASLVANLLATIGFGL